MALDVGSNPKISVIIPSYNSGTTVRHAIESVLAQTHPIDEIIVVDDGSADDTEHICREFDDDVQYHRQSNAGASAARNTGARLATSEFLAFLDADDVWEAEKVEIQMSAFDQNPEADFCISAALVWSSREQAYFKYEWAGCQDPQELRRQLLVRNIFTGLCSSIVIRRSAFEAVGGFASGKLSEDRRIAIELLARHRGLILPHALVRQKPGPASFSDPAKMRRAMLDLVSDYLPLYQQLDPKGRLLRRARARVYERAGMHHLDNGDMSEAAKNLARAAVLWPFMANPWKFLANACLGRLRKQKRIGSPLVPAGAA
ncbi:MAG: glycosyltransferase family 2 protein [Planctomycetes bacterium]|nr:glycosyltransferase family 2 protein [Planctomycetota bacterium]